MKRIWKAIAPILAGGAVMALPIPQGIEPFAYGIISPFSWL